MSATTSHSFAHAETSGGAAPCEPQSHFTWRCAASGNEYQIYEQDGQARFVAEFVGGVIFIAPCQVFYCDKGREPAMMAVFTSESIEPIGVMVDSLLMFEMLGAFRQVGVLVVEDDEL